MKLTRLGEFGLIERVRRATPKRRDVLLGIGDDAAWVSNKLRSSLVTSDLLIEGFHFNLKWTSLFALGYKTLAVNLSDIAAMGGIPAYLILALGIPASFHSEQIDEFYRGIRSLAAKTHVALIGGDTNRADSLLIAACLIGHAPYRPIRRAGARVGDDIYVTGTLGDSALALRLLKSKSAQRGRGQFAYLLSRHHQPTPRLTTGLTLARERLATAMIDVSDGLVQDLGHICKASGVGAVIAEQHIPLSPAYRAIAGRDGVRHALTGGEDYELLFCARRRDRARIEKLQSRTNVAMTRLGTCVSGHPDVIVLDRQAKRLPMRVHGHDHFQSMNLIGH
jgi:thiamine-monophosphate kinase